MNIASIRAFLEVSSSGSFQRAADNLSITQSAMSARIKGLEDQLNRQLFNRKRNGATLTSAGKTFYNHALTVVRTWELARQEIALADEFNGVVGLGVQLNHWQSIATPWLLWMKQNAPDVATQIKSDYSDRLMSMLRNGLISAAVLYEPQSNPHILIETYTEEQLVLVSSTPREVSKTTVDGYIYVDWGSNFRAEHSRAFPDTPMHRMTVGLAVVAQSHILEHGGSAYLLLREVQRHLDSGLLHKVRGAPELSLTNYLAYFDSSEANPALQSALQGLHSIKNTYLT